MMMMNQCTEKEGAEDKEDDVDESMRKNKK